MKKAIIVAYDLNPKLGSESGAAHLWARVASQFYAVDIYVSDTHREDIVLSDYPRARFHFIGLHPIVRRTLQRLSAFNFLNGLFVRRVKALLRGLNLSEYGLIHVLTPAGVHSFNDLYLFGVPVVAGPLGGALPTPPGFRSAFKNEALKNGLRALFYRMIVRWPGWRKYFQNASTILVGTDFVKSVLPLECRGRCQVFFDTSVDTDYYQPALARRSPGPQLKILFAGALSSIKGIIFLIEAVQLCRARGLRSFEVMVAGEGPLRERVDSLLREYGLGDCVKLLGRLPREALLKEYQDSDFFCLPTLREHGGTAILEAMACGLPVITSNYGGPKDSVTDQCGIKIDMNGPEQYLEDLSSAIERLARDEDLRCALGRGARQRAEEKFSIKVVEAKILDIYGRYLG